MAGDSHLTKRHCQPCSGETPVLSESEIRNYLKETPQWKYEAGCIIREFKFGNYYETTAFVNAVVWIAHREDHHPDISFGYRTCRVSYRTHAIKGLSINDFIAAAKIDELITKE